MTFQFVEIGANLLDTIYRFITVLWWYLSVIYNSYNISNLMAILPKYGTRHAATVQLITIFKTHQHFNVQFLQFIKGLPSLSKNGVVALSFMFHPVLVLSKASPAKKLLSSKENVEKSIIYNLGKTWVGNGLGTSRKSQWRTRRKIIAPTLHPKVPAAYFPVFQECADVLCSKLFKLTGQELDILPILKYCTLDAVIVTTMGVKSEIQKNEDPEYLKSIHILSSIVFERVMNVFYWADVTFKLFPKGKEYFHALNYVKNFTTKIIEQRKLEIKKLKHDSNSKQGGLKVKKSLILLDTLLDLYYNDDAFQIDDLYDEIETVLLGGHDTAALHMGWTLFLLGQNQECQTKAQQEIDDVFELDPDIPLQVEDLKKLTYVECVIKEAGRLYTPAPIFGRHMDEEFVIDDVVIPKGTQCFVSVDAVHRDPEVYPDPEMFIPERFLPNNIDQPDPDAFLAFSSGPRGCPGSRFAMLEMKIIISTILKRFTVKSTLPRDKIVMEMEVTQSPINGLPVSFEPR